MVVFFSIVPISIGVTEILERLSTGLKAFGAAVFTIQATAWACGCPTTRSQPSEDLLERQAFSLFKFSDLTGLWGQRSLQPRRPTSLWYPSVAADLTPSRRAGGVLSGNTFACFYQNVNIGVAEEPPAGPRSCSLCRLLRHLTAHQRPEQTLREASIFQETCAFPQIYHLLDASCRKYEGAAIVSSCVGLRGPCRRRAALSSD